MSPRFSAASDAGSAGMYPPILFRKKIGAVSAVSADGFPFGNIPPGRRCSSPGAPYPRASRLTESVRSAHGMSLAAGREPFIWKFRRIKRQRIARRPDAAEAGTENQTSFHHIHHPLNDNMQKYEDYGMPIASRLIWIGIIFC